MSETTQTSAAPFAARTVAILIAVAVFSFGAIMVLAGWSPELRDRDRAGDHPFSTSAIGYNGIVQLLEAQGYPVEISRFKSNLDSHYGLMVLTLSTRGMRKSLEEYDLQSDTLIILPKWSGMVDWTNPSRMKDTDLATRSSITSVLEALGIEGDVVRTDVPDQVTTPFGRMALQPDLQLQLIQSEELTPIVNTRDGALLSELSGRGIYILSDPDMINTFGLAERENARFAMQMINMIRYDADEPIIFDATLHGFTRSENLLQMMFDVPFLGVTLVALAAALLLGWAASIRFGPPARETRAIALGKQALADNSAGLVSMARRETRMAPGYLSLIRRRLARQIGAPRNLTEAQLSELFDRLGPEDVSGKTFSQIEAGLRGPAASREDLMHKARDLWRWRRDILRRSMNDPS
ncbi:hypothetical protein [uncultured Hyphomonas sp.]|uniref:DUF4350 domain-containing protein n=1 Tax=uncultured Hyphomonas sp. TaxID=225298 RepID=UPI002AAAA3A9|nr:hypothetical protein [uncultured Hyphomonas sp.]